MTSSRYPNDPAFKLIEADRSCLVVDGREYGCEVHVRRDEPEGDDILMVTDGEAEFLVHGSIFFQALTRQPSTFLADFEPSQLDRLRALEYVYCDAMEESRNHFRISVSGVPVDLIGHYLDARFYPFVLNGILMTIVAGLIDAEGRAIPRVVTRIPSKWFLFSSARYDAADDWWDFVDPEDPLGEKAKMESELLLQRIIERNNLKKAQQVGDGDA